MPRKRLIPVYVIASALAIIVLYLTLGRYVLTEAYFERSLSLLNNIFEGRSSHSLSFYIHLADVMVIKLVISIISLSVLPYLIPQISIYFKYRKSVRQKFSVMTVSLSQAVTASFITFIIAALPLCFVSIPPLIDYPNHLARVFILDNWRHSFYLQSWYHVHSFLLPNMGMDILCLLIAKIMPIEIAGRVSIALIFGVTIGGCIFLHRCLYGHFSLWPLLSSMFLFNWIFLLGFLNYLLGIGFLMWTVGGWILICRRGTVLRIAYGNLVSVLLFFCHLSSLGLYAIILAGYEIQRSLSAIQEKRLKGICDIIISVSTFIIPIVLFMLSKTAGEVKSGVWYKKPLLWSKLAGVYSSLMFGIPAADILAVATIFFILLVLMISGKLEISKQVYLAMTLIVITYFLLPYGLLDSSFADARIPIAIIFFGLSVSQIKLSNKYLHYTVIIVLAAFLTFRSIIFSYAWSVYDTTISNITKTYNKMPPNAILFVANEDNFPLFYKNRIQHPPVWHLASLATIHQMAFVPEIWANPSEQPIIVNDRYRPIWEFQKGDPIKLDNRVTLEETIEKIKDLIKNAELYSMPIYLLILDPKTNYTSTPNFYEVVDSGSRFKLLLLKMSSP